MKTLRWIGMAVFAILMCVGFASCGDDDEEDLGAGLYDFYVEVEVSGGGLTAQELSTYKKQLDISDKIYTDLTEVTQTQAIYAFDRFIENLKNAYRSGLSGVTGTLSVVYALKERKAGTTVKTSTLLITKDGCTIK